MGRIQSSIGLVTGIPIADTVDQLIALAARPRNLLLERTAQLSQQQVGITALTALAIGVEFSVNQLAKDNVFQARVASSSDSSLLSVSVTGQPLVGTQQFTPVRQAKNHQLLTTGFSATDQAIGAGTLKFRLGGFIDQSVRLNELNDGSGVQRGEVRITDRSGASAVIDLRFVQTVDDVLAAVRAL
ncbi:MAG: hypothetical protein IH991_12695 [Planctomycetes bacterium]|nr:hypothetical protein [Planctomycetota bacterium]